MAITYYPTYLNLLPAAKYPLFTYPGIPLGLGVGSSLTLPDLVFASVIDIMEGCPLESPLNLEWLFGMFESALDENPPRIQLRKYDLISRSWKRALSETIANAVSLAIAIFEEGFDWAVPVTLIKDPTTIPYWWPWTSTIFYAQPAFNPPLVQHPLMPDFLLGETSGGITSFSSMEVKGRDAPLDTANLASYEDFKRQSENIQLCDLVGTPFPLQRKILSVVAVRPSLINHSNREIKCRWFNHSETKKNVPRGSLAQIALTHCSILLFRLFGIQIELDPYSSGHILLDTPQLSPDFLIASGLVPLNNGYILPTTTQDRSSWRPYISGVTVDLLSKVQREIYQSRYPVESLHLIDDYFVKFLEKQPIFLRENGPMLRIGIGLVYVQ